MASASYTFQTLIIALNEQLKTTNEIILQCTQCHLLKVGPETKKMKLEGAVAYCQNCLLKCKACEDDITPSSLRYHQNWTCSKRYEFFSALDKQKHSE